MPIYEYRCQDCQAEVSIWFSSIAQAAASTALCTTCGGEHLARLVSNIGMARSGATASRESADAGGTPGERPQELAQAMRAAAAGRDMGNDFREVAARLDKGENAAAVEASLRQRVGEKTQPH
jgi:putative FmdB family regulatory protein